jgi:hypothetical protein
MTENRRDVLEMLSAGKVSAEEADRLLALLDAEPVSLDRATPRPPAQVRYLRILVDAQDDDGPVHVNVRVPLQLLRAGVRLASVIPTSAQGQVNDAMREHGVPFDLSQIKPENLEELVDQLRDLTIDVEQPKENLKVRVFCE